MGLLKKFNTLLQHPLVETIINLIKKFKSSKSYWSVSYLILLFTIREAIAWQFGSAIREFCEKQANDSDYATVWDIVGFVFDTGGSIELVGLGLFIFLVLSIVKVSEANGETKPTPFREKLLGFVIALALMLVFFTMNYYQHQSTISDINQTIAHESKKIQITQNQHSQDLQEIKNLIKLQGGDETAFLEKYFGKDYEIVLNNPITYHNFTTLLKTTNKTPNELLEEREKLLNKIKNQSLESSIQKMVDKAFKELRYDDARALLDNFISNNQAIGDDLIKAHYQKALTYMQEVKYHEAKEEYETYIPMGIKDTDILHDYGEMYYRLGEYDKYLEVNTRRLALLLEDSDSNSVEIARAYNEIGGAWQSKGEYDKAIEFYSKSLDIKLATLREQHSSTAISYGNIGEAWRNKGEYDKAIEYYSKALEIQLATLGEQHPDTATSYNNIGAAWQNKGEYNKALEYYTKALKIRLATLGEQHPDTATSYNNIGFPWDNKGEYDKAIEYHSKALEIRLATLGEQHPDTATSYNNIAISYYYLGDFQKAYEYMEKAVRIREVMLPENHPRLLESKEGLEIIKAKLNEQK